VTEFREDFSVDIEQLINIKSETDILRKRIKAYSNYFQPNEPKTIAFPDALSC